MTNSMAPYSSVRILLVDDYEPWRKNISSELRKMSEFQIVGEVADGVEAVQRAQELKPDLILLDIGLPGLNGIEVANRLHQLVPQAKILFLSENHDAEVVRAALSDGARGYVVKVDTGSELLPAITAILRGERYVSCGIRGAFPVQQETGF
jgi:DNA-binding NarL/FixJ family response regulator